MLNVYTMEACRVVESGPRSYRALPFFFRVGFEEVKVLVS